MKPVQLVLSACALALLATCGGGNSGPTVPLVPTPPPTTTLLPATLADLSASVTSPQNQARLNCRNAIHAAVTLDNRASSSVSVSGIENTSRVLSGGCGAAEPFTFMPAVRSVGPGQAVTVFNDSLYNQGSGCCLDKKGCSGTCEIEESFRVLTGPGAVVAGKFTYRVNFDGCPVCGLEGTSLSGRRGCPSR